MNLTFDLNKLVSLVLAVEHHYVSTPALNWEYDIKVNLQNPDYKLARKQLIVFLRKTIETQVALLPYDRGFRKPDPVPQFHLPLRRKCPRFPWNFEELQYNEGVCYGPDQICEAFEYGFSSLQKESIKRHAIWKALTQWLDIRWSFRKKVVEPLPQNLWVRSPHATR